MRKLLPLVLTAALAACSSAAPPAPAPTTTTAPPPPAVAAFLAEVAEPGAVAFRATYRVLRKLGGVESTIEVVGEPPSWRITVEDLVITPEQTCRAGRCRDGVQEAELAAYGVFSTFFATGPARALATDARRSAAGPVVLTERTVAGVGLRCAGMPINGDVASTLCLTPQGVVGWVDNPSVRYELTAYQPG